MLRIALLSAVLVLGAQASPHAQSKATVTYGQQALTELGYDPGPVDGAWGGKTRTALNEYRARNQLPPSQSLSGSSLYLLHRDAPGEQTLPHPGIAPVNFADRRAYLAENRGVGERFCNNNLRLPPVSEDWEPVTQFQESRATARTGFITNEEDWHSEYSEGLSISTAQCLNGDDHQCDVVWTFIKKWSVDDTLNTPVGKSRNSEPFDGVAWIANSVLTPLIVSTAVAIEIGSPNFTEVAPVLDWLYERVNHFHHVVNRNVHPGATNNTAARNHALAAVLPSMALGSLIGDRELFDRGAPQFQAALDNMRSDGSFPTETRRGSRALAYTGLQLAYLFAMAEFAKAQEVDFYEMSGSKGQNLHMSVEYAVKGWSDWDQFVLPYAKANFAAPKDPQSPMATAFESYFGWLPIYRLRFPDHPNQARLKELVLDPVICSQKHVDDGRSADWWCRKAGPPPITLPEMLLDTTDRISIFNHAMGYNAGCALSEDDTLFDY